MVHREWPYVAPHGASWGILGEVERGRGERGGGINGVLEEWWRGRLTC